MRRHERLLQILLRGQIVNLQSRGGRVKPYQVRQIRKLILQYDLGGND